MEELTLRYEQLLKACTQLKKALQVFHEAALVGEKQPLSEQEEVILFMHRDSVIKRFELCYELLWKYCKIALYHHYNLEEKSPRGVFRACEHQGIITLADMDQLLHIVNVCNGTTHVYDAAMASMASTQILRYHTLMVTTAQKLAPFKAA